MSNNTDRYLEAVSLASSAIKETAVLTSEKRNFYINYIAKCILKIWSESGKGYTNELAISAQHPCTQNFVIDNLERLLSTTKPMINNIYKNDPDTIKKEGEGYEFIFYEALKLKNPISLEQSGRNLDDLINPLSDIPPFVITEFSMVHMLALTLAFGFLDVNHEWFRFDKKGYPIGIEASQIQRILGICGLAQEAKIIRGGTASADELEEVTARLLKLIQQYKEDYFNNKNVNVNNLTRSNKPAGAAAGAGGGAAAGAGGGAGGGRRQRRKTKNRRSKFRRN